VAWTHARDEPSSSNAMIREPAPALVEGVRSLLVWGRTRVGRAMVLVLFTTLIAALGIISFLSYSGFCFSQMRFLSGKEYFDAVINEIIEQPSHVVETHGEGYINMKLVTVRRYNVDEFNRSNPNCCKLVPHNAGDRGPYISLSERMIGHAGKIVSVTYTVNYVDEDGQSQSALANEQYAVSNCGRAWNPRH
jgi:hypothetical protein